MAARQDLTNKRFGRLVAISFNEQKTKETGSKHRYWNCVCDCGGSTIVNVNTLNRRKVISCGCYNKEKNRLPKGEAQRNNIFIVYKKGAEKNKREFSLSKEEFNILISDNCYYCGKSPSNIKISRDPTISEEWKKQGIFYYNGIDRVDNNKGYSLDNVVTCCSQCNRAKLDSTKEEFLKMIKDIYERHFL